jgi:hypothetical protein
MEFEIAKIDNIESSVSSNAPTDSPFTPRIQLLHSLSQIIKEWKSDGDKPVEGDFWFGPPGGLNLKRQIYVVPISTRDHALRYSGKSVIFESFQRQSVEAHPPRNREEEIFREIEKSPKNDVAKKQMNMWGADTLFWLPQLKTFAIYFFHSTARNVVGKFKDSSKNVNNLGKLMILSSVTIKSSQFSWPSPEATIAPPFDLSDSEQLTLSEQIKGSIPSPEKIKEEVTKFLNPVPQGGGRDSISNPGGGIR